MIAGGLFFFSLFQPALIVERFWIFERQISLIGGIFGLIEGGQAALGWGVLVLTVGLPAAKTLLGLLISSFARSSGPILRTAVWVFGLLGKWSLADVFVLAILVMVIDGQVLTQANVALGAYMFAAGVLLATAANYWLDWAIRRTRRAATRDLAADDRAPTHEGP